MLKQNLGAGFPASAPRVHGERADADIGRGRDNGRGAAIERAPNLNRASNIEYPTPAWRDPAITEAVLRSFNTWAFKREQPTDPQLMLQIISESIALEAPVPFVLYWGKGPRCGLDEPDVQCLDYLAALARRVRTVYASGATIRLIFTDTHAELNGHSLQTMRDYFGAIEICAGQRGFDTCRLSDLLRRADITPEQVDEPLPEETLRRLCASAVKWYHGNGTPEQGAAKYYQMNMAEKRAVELAFPRSIFITFNGSKFRNLFPDRLPIFFMYSLRRGVSVKPWFLPAVAAG